MQPLLVIVNARLYYTRLYYLSYVNKHLCQYRSIYRRERLPRTMINFDTDFDSIINRCTRVWEWSDCDRNRDVSLDNRVESARKRMHAQDGSHGPAAAREFSRSLGDRGLVNSWGVARGCNERTSRNRQSRPKTDDVARVQRDDEEHNGAISRSKQAVQLNSRVAPKCAACPMRLHGVRTTW